MKQIVIDETGCVKPGVKQFFVGEDHDEEPSLENILDAMGIDANEVVEKFNNDDSEELFWGTIHASVVESRGSFMNNKQSKHSASIKLVKQQCS